MIIIISVATPETVLYDEPTDQTAAEAAAPAPANERAAKVNYNLFQSSNEGATIKRGGGGGGGKNKRLKKEALLPLPTPPPPRLSVTSKRNKRRSEK